MKRSFIQPGQLASDQSVEVFFERERCETQRWLYQEMDLLVGRLFGRLKEQFFKEFDDDDEEEVVVGGETNPRGGFGPGPRPVTGLVSRPSNGSVPCSGSGSGSGSGSVPGSVPSLAAVPALVPIPGPGSIFNGKRLDHIRPATLTPEELTQLILLQKSKSQATYAQQPSSKSNSVQLAGQQSHQLSTSTVKLTVLPQPVLFRTSSSEQFTINNRRSPRLNRQTIYPNLDDDDNEEEIPLKRSRNVLEPNGIDDVEVLHQVEVVHPPASMMNSLERSGTATTTTANSRVSALSLLPRIVMTPEERERHLQELSRRLFDPNYVPEPQNNKSVPQEVSEPEVKLEISDDDHDHENYVDNDDANFDADNLLEVQVLEPLVQVEGQPKVKGEIDEDDDNDETGNFLERPGTFQIESNPSKTKTTEKLIAPDGQEFTYAGEKQPGQLFLLKPSSSSNSSGQFAVMLQQPPTSSSSSTTSPGQFSRQTQSPNSSQLSGQLKTQPDQARPRVVTRNFNKTFNNSRNGPSTGQLSDQLQTRSRSKFANQSRQFAQSGPSTSTGQLQTRSQSKANPSRQLTQPSSTSNVQFSQSVPSSSTSTGQFSGHSLQPGSSLQLTQSGPSTLTIQLSGGLSQPSSSSPTTPNQPTKAPTLKLTGLSPSTSEKLTQFLAHEDDDHDYDESSFNQAIRELIDEDNDNQDTEVDTDLEEPADQMQQNPAAHIAQLESSERLLNELKKSNTRKNAFNPFTISSLKCNQVNCLEMFSTTDEFNDHLKAEHWILKFQCHLRYCGASFDSSSACLDHVREEHRAVTVWYCARCPLDFKTYLLLKRHTVNYHEEGQFRCAKDGCDYVTSTRGPAISHYLKKHAKKRVCEFAGCGKELYGSTRYKIHQRKHEHIRPYKCKWPDCTYTSTSKPCALSHIRVMHLNKVAAPPSPPRRGARKKIIPKPAPRAPVDPNIYLEVDTEMLNKERLKYKSLKNGGVSGGTAAAD